jgi:hypothetical protein
MFKILVTGSREWDNIEFISRTLGAAKKKYQDLVVVHGDCQDGADRWANEAYFESRGTRDAVKRSLKAKIPVVAWEEYRSEDVWPVQIDPASGSVILLCDNFSILSSLLPELPTT